MINASDDEHKSIILGKPLSQISKCYSRCWERDCHFWSRWRKALIRISFKTIGKRDPLQRALENEDAQDDQDGELVETMEKFEDIGELDQEEDGAPDVEMKSLPKGLKYEFLGDGKNFPVIISD